MLLTLFLCPFLTGTAASAEATLRLHPGLASHAVLQRHQPVPVLGHATPGHTVHARLFVNALEFEATADVDAEGAFRLDLPGQEAGGPHRLSVEQRDPDGGAVATVFLDDLLFGEVWLASGQSNMEWSVDRSDGAEAVRAQPLPAIRHLQVQRNAQAEPAAEPLARWHRTEPDSTGSFSAVAHHFARRVHAETGVPVGILHASWGGTPAIAWTPREALLAHPVTAPQVTRDDASANRRPQARPGFLYRGMIDGLAHTPIAGVIWYQGESDRREPQRYRTLFPMLIRSWRERFGRAELPFFFVQLARYQEPLGEEFVEQPWAQLRDAQTFARDTVPHTGMAVIVDLDDPDPNNIHPGNKSDVGRRLAGLALREVYGLDVVARGPRIKAVTRVGAAVAVSFESDAPALRTDDAQAPAEFWLRDASGTVRRAQAQIQGEDVVSLQAEGVSDPVEVLYAATQNPAGVNLTDASGLPAEPFRQRVSE